jgi:hypothetical protein
MMRKAGLTNVEEETKSLPWTWPGTAEEVWQYVQSVSTPFLALLQRVPAESRDELDREAITSIRQYADGDSIKFGAVVALVSGMR